MADPIIATGIRAQVVHQGISGLPEDRYVNSWAFLASGDVTAAHQAEVADLLRDFYFEPTTGGQQMSVADWMPGHALQATAFTIRTYDMGQAPPREPTVHSPSITEYATQIGLPNEVAICLSFFSTRNLPGRRGRVYIGPLMTSAAANVDGEIRPNSGLITTLTEAAERLMGAQDQVLWSVLGTGGPGVGQELLPVTEGWVDNAFDTQRRRGVDATTRFLFGP